MTWHVYIIIYIYVYENHDLWDFPKHSQVFSLRPENATAIINERLTVAMALWDDPMTRDFDLTTLSWSFISCYIIFDDLWWSLMIFDDLWLLYFVSYFILFLSIHLKKRVQSPRFRVHLRSPPMLVFVPERSDFRSGDGGEHLDDCPEHRTGGVATGGTFSRWKLWNVMNMSGMVRNFIHQNPTSQLDFFRCHDLEYWYCVRESIQNPSHCCDSGALSTSRTRTGSTNCTSYDTGDQTYWDWEIWVDMSRYESIWGCFVSFVFRFLVALRSLGWIRVDRKLFCRYVRSWCRPLQKRLWPWTLRWIWCERGNGTPRNFLQLIY